MHKRGLLHVAQVVPLLLTALLLHGSVCAETYYVTDMLYITVRAGKDSGARIATLPSNTSVSVIEESERHMKIRTKKGVEGWVGSQYLTTEPPKADIIEEQSQEIDALRTEIARLQGDSRDVDNLTAQIDQLKKDNTRLARDVEYLRRQTKTPRPPEMFWWFLAGGGVFLCGVLAGVLTKRKKYYIDALR